MVTAVVTLSAALLLAPAPGVGQVTDDLQATEDAASPFGEQLTVFDREGNVVRTIGERGLYNQAVFSPDRTRLAVEEDGDIWVFDLSDGTRLQLTFRGYFDGGTSPVWSPDGSQVAYVGRRDSYWGLYRQASNGEGGEELLYQHGGPITLTDWSLDGRFLSFFAAEAWGSGTLSGSRLYLLPLDGDGQAIEVASSESIMVEARLSPDSRFLAYRSDETGRSEIFVRSVALPGGTNAAVEQWQVSTEGALGMASWRQDGQELYYFGVDRGVMAVEINSTQGFEFGRPRRLFSAPEAIWLNPEALVAPGSVSRDGQRFVFRVPPPPLDQITVFDREGNVVSRLGEPGPYRRPTFSPDGSRVAVLKTDPETGTDEVWTFDVSTSEGMPVPVTADESGPFKWALIWSPDGTHLAYVSYVDNTTGIYRKAWNGDGSEELLFRQTTPGSGVFLYNFSAAGRFLSVDGGNIVLVVPLTGTDPFPREGVEVIREEVRARGGWFSPDSRFIAYTSNESGIWQLYVRRFDTSSGTVPTEEKWQISEDEAHVAHWRQDGKEMFYLTEDTETTDLKVMAVDVTTTPEFQVGTPRLLFRVGDLGESNPRNRMRVRPDGQRFVFAMPVPAGDTPAP